MQKKVFPWILGLTMMALIVSCTDSEEMDPDDPQISNDLNFEFTLTGNESNYSMKIDGVEVQNSAEILNSLNTDKSISLNFWGPNFDFDFAGISWIPLGTGTYQTGHNLGTGNGTEGNDLFMVAFVKQDGEKHYAYSSHAYGYLEDERIPGSSCTVEIITFEGGQTTYEFMNGTYSLFIGTVEGKFAGTFKTKEGKEVNVTNGQFRIVRELPPGAVVLD